MKTISKTEAKKIGRERYFTGKPCIRGHVSERYLSGHCVACRQEQERRRREKHREKRRAESLAYYYANRQSLNEKKREKYLSKNLKAPKN